MDVSNIVIMAGNLARDPDAYTNNDGRKCCQITICVNTFSKGKDYKNFFRWVAWGRQAETISERCIKGSGIMVAGSAVQKHKYEKNGVEYPATVEFWVSSWRFFGEKKNTKAYREEQRKKEDFMDLPDDISDELPFE